MEFLITSKDITGSGACSTLLIFNNERGFSSTNIDSICRVGKSTKKGNRHQGYIGEKGKYQQLVQSFVFLTKLNYLTFFRGKISWNSSISLSKIMIYDIDEMILTNGKNYVYCL